AQGLPSENISVQNCIMRADTGNYQEGDGCNIGNYSNIRFVGNKVFSPARHGYEGGGNCYNQYFAFNTIDMNSVGLSGLNLTGGNRSSVIGNTILNCTTFGIDFTVDVGVTFFSKNNRIIGNYVATVGSGVSVRIQ